MIDVKILSKPKKQGGGSGSSTSKTTYITGTASEAEHALKADKANRAEASDRADYATKSGTAQSANYAAVAGELAKDSETLQDYLYKGETEEAQEVKGKVTFGEIVKFLSEIVAETTAKLNLGATFGGSGAYIDHLGDTVLNSLRSLDYANAAEQGFSIEKENGKYHAFVTNLTVWGKAVFHELEIRKLSYAGGNIYLSGAGSKLIKVVPVVWNATTAAWDEVATDAECEGWKCYLLDDNGTTATMNYWKEGDQVKCQTMGQIISGGTYEDVSNKSYWRTIPDNGVSTVNEKIYGTKTETYLDDENNEQTREVQVELYDGQAFAWIVIGKHSKALDNYTEDTAPTETKDTPSAGDTIVLDGNRKRGDDGGYAYEDRQNVIIMETTGDDAPRIVGYYHVTEYKHTYTNDDGDEVPLYVFLLSAKEGVKFNSSSFEWISADGSAINMINYRGDWLMDSTYYKNDQVNYDNAVWVCVANSGDKVKGEVPSEDSTVWKKILEGGKGEKGDKGDKGDKGEDGAPGEKGNDGRGISSTVTKYYTWRSDTGVEASTIWSGGSTTMPTDFNDTYPWLWSVTMTYYTDGTSSLGAAVCVGYKAKNGNKGEKGDDAYRVVVSPSILVLDTDDAGKVTSFPTSKTASISIYKGSDDVTSSFWKDDSYPSNYSNCNGRIANLNSKPYSVYVTSIESDNYTDPTTNETTTVSKTNGFLEFYLTNGTDTVIAHVEVQVNVSKYMGSVQWNNKQWSSKYAELSNSLSDKVGSSELTSFKTEVLQDARSWSVEVSQKAVGRRNLLVGSAARKNGEGWGYMSGGNSIDNLPCEQIEINSGMEGTNCIHCRTKQTGADSYYSCGYRWYGNSPQGNIKIERGKTYTLSFWAKTDNPSNVVFVAEVLWQGSKTDASRPAGYMGPTGYSTTFGIDSTDKGKWVKFQVQIVFPGDDSYQYKDYEYVEICIFARATSYTLTEAYLCKPMLEEGGNYNGWTLSEQDYDYVGGNLLDNTNTLIVGDNLKSNAILSKDDEGVAVSTRSVASSVASILSFNLALKANTDYVLSYYIKSINGGADKVSHTLNLGDNIQFAEYENGGTSQNTSSADHTPYSGYIDRRPISSQWTRVWYHFRLISNTDTQNMMMQIYGYGGAGSISIKKPKLEEGATMTEWTERKTDLIDKASLKAAGINVTADMVEIYGDQVKISNSKGGTAVAMFENGMLNADLINAALLTAQQLLTSGVDKRYVSIKDGLLQIFGTNGICNIEFGVNDKGEAILSYYDNTGKWLYDLGPNKLDGSTISSSTVTTKEYVKATTLLGTESFYSTVTYAGITLLQATNSYSYKIFGSNMYINGDDEVNKNSAAHIGFQPCKKLTSIKFYLYKAPRVGNAIIADTEYGLTTPDLAAAADGKYFTSTTMASGGALTNLAPVGIYFEKTATVRMPPFPMTSGSVKYPAFSIQMFKITEAGNGTVMSGFNALFSYLTKTVNGEM